MAVRPAGSLPRDSWVWLSGGKQLNAGPDFVNAAGFWALDVVAAWADEAIVKSAPLFCEDSASLAGCCRTAHDAVAGSRLAWHTAACARLHLGETSPLAAKTPNCLMTSPVNPNICYKSNFSLVKDNGLTRVAHIASC